MPQFSGPPTFDTTYMGIDIGTSVAKAALFDELGNVVAVATSLLELFYPAPGQVEQDPDAVIRGVAEVIAAIRRESGGDVPRVVAVTGQGDGVWLLDANGHPVRPAISWMDGRAGALLSHWEADGIAEKVFRINGNALFCGAQAPILRWLDAHEPESLARAATSGFCKDMVFQRLTGVRATDSSDASLPFADASGADYSDEVLAATGLSHRRTLLAPIVRPLPTGQVSAEGVREFGLPEGTTVVSGPFDLPACALGGGVSELGEGLLTVGTTLACQVLIGEVDTAGNPSGMTLATPTEGRWLRAMPAMVGCASLDWVLALLGLKHAQLDEAVNGTPPGANGVEMLPYLAPSGERAPFVDSRARGQYSGMRLTTTREDLVRATCESLAYAAKDCFEAAGLSGRLLVCGGGARSVPWLRIFASVLGRPLYVARSPEVGARGAVLAALEASDIPHDVHAWTHPEAVIEPQLDTLDIYQDGYARYLRHKQSAQSLWRAS